jgi:uncharacterized protein
MSQLDAIVALQATLSELVAARKKLDSIPDWMAAVHTEYSQRKAEIDAEEAVAEEADRNRRLAEAEFEDAQTKLKHFQAQIAQVTNQREYGALLREIDAIKEKIKGAEELAISAIEANEAARQKVDALRQAFAELDARYQAEISKWEAEKPAVLATASKLEAEADGLRQKLSRGTATLFDRLFERTGGDAVARVIRVTSMRAGVLWHCAGCHFNVRPQTVVEVRSGAIHHCESCKRILFWQDEPKDADE